MFKQNPVQFAGKTYQPTGSTKKSCDDKMKAMDQSVDALATEDLAAIPEQAPETKKKKA